MTLFERLFYFFRRKPIGSPFEPPISSVFMATISGSFMQVDAVSFGKIQMGYIGGCGIQHGTAITQQLSGDDGGIGLYLLNHPYSTTLQTIAQYGRKL